TALREVFEETGMDYCGELVHLLHMDTRTFVYDSFLMVVEEEFDPLPSPESAGFAWLPLEGYPQPLHWGLCELLSDRTAVSLLVKAVEQQSGRPCPFRKLSLA